MTDTSTTPADNPTNSDATPGTTATDPKTGTDNQTAPAGDNLDASKSTDDTSSAGDDTSNNGDTSKTDDGGEDTTPASEFDSDLDEWIEKRKGRAPRDDDERRDLQELRNSQREFTKQQQSSKASVNAKSLGDEINQSRPKSNVDPEDDDRDDLEKRQDAIEAQLNGERTQRLQSEFYTENEVTEEQHKAIMDIFKEKVSRPVSYEAKKKAFDYWSEPDALPDLLDLAKARIVAGVDTSVITEEAREEERKRIAKESQASSPGRGAKVATDGNKTPEQERLERFSNWD